MDGLWSWPITTKQPEPNCCLRHKQKARFLYSYLGPWAPHIFTDMACTLLKGVDTLSSNQIRADGFIGCQENAISRIFNMLSIHRI